MLSVRLIWVLAGIVCAGLGALGLVLPLLPGTPFVLLAAICFARSSRRLHNWITDHQWFGPLIEDWQRNGAIARRTKVLALITLIATPFITYFIGAPIFALLLQVFVLAGAGLWIWSRPEPE